MPITNLPPEILTQIFRTLRPYSSWQPLVHDVQDIKAISRVNKTWYEIARPLLYSCITINSGKWLRDPDRIESLCQTLKIRPDYQKYIKSLSISFGENTVTKEAVNTLTQCTNVRTLSLQGFMEQNYHAALIDLVMRSNACKLRLNDECAAFILSHMLRHGKPENLKSLRVKNYAELYRPEMPPSAIQANIDSLHIFTNCWPAKSIENLMRWAKHLRELRFDISDTVYLFDQDHELLETPALQRLLDIHQGTLQVIQLGGWEDPGNSCLVDMSAYTKLKRLRVHKDNVFEGAPDYINARLPPGLLCLEIDLTGHEAWYLCDQLYEEDVAWLGTFFATRKRTIPDHSLKQVHVIYRFNDADIVHCELTNYIMEEPWPCQTLVDAVSILSRFGVSLTYPEEYMSKVEWETMIKEQTVPDWEYYTTKEERIAVVPATEDEILHHASGIYIHDNDQGKSAEFSISSSTLSAQHCNTH